MKEAGARRAALEEEEDLEVKRAKCRTLGISSASVPAPRSLPDAPLPCSGTPCESRCAATRDDAPEAARHLAQLDLGQTGRGGARDRGRPDEPGLQPGECASILANTVVEWVLADLAVLSCGGVSNGIYPTDGRRRCSTCARTRAPRPVRRGRRAARQGARVCATGCRGCARSWCSTWKACAPFRPEVMSLEALRDLGRPNTRRASRKLSERASPPCRPRTWRSWSTPRHHRPAGPRARCIARGPGLTPCAATTPDRRAGRGDERICFLPLCHIAERMGGEYFAVYTGATLNFVERTPETVPRTCARSRRRCSPPCRACGRSSIRRDDRAEGPTALQQAPTPGRSASARRRRQGARRQPVRGAGARSSRWRAGWRWTTCAS